MRPVPLLCRDDKGGEKKVRLLNREFRKQTTVLVGGQKDPRRG